MNTLDPHMVYMIPIRSMGLVYLPIHGWLILDGFRVGRYASPMDPSWDIVG